MTATRANNGDNSNKGKQQLFINKMERNIDANNNKGKQWRQQQQRQI
jgi:hypothetical protein